MALNGFFITGTDTGVGKTWFTAGLTRALRMRGLPALGLKPILCGERTDAEMLAAANNETLTLNEINPVWWKPPVAPYTAAVIEDRPFDFAPIRETLARLAATHPGPFLIEAVGGWLVPITREISVREWAQELGLPVLVVCRAALGTLNHTRLTVESIRSSGLPLTGLVMNAHGTAEDDLAAQTNPAILEDLTNLPVWSVHDESDLAAPPPWIFPRSPS
ncbi:MAG: dethiobiotin synthase [Candidatus Methylacidiphilales bacterium]|nr:dethiobiotin synthase [Candidatus Methylacidiphilales bacterium]